MSKSPDEHGQRHKVQIQNIIEEYGSSCLRSVTIISSEQVLLEFNYDHSRGRRSDHIKRIVHVVDGSIKGDFTVPCDPPTLYDCRSACRQGCGCDCLLGQGYLSDKDIKFPESKYAEGHCNKLRVVDESHDEILPLFRE